MSQIFGIADTGADKGNSQAAWVQPRLAAGQPPALHIPDPDSTVNVWPAVAVQPPTSAIVAPPSSLGAFARELLAVAGSSVAFARSVGYALAASAGSSRSLTKGLAAELRAASGGLASLLAARQYLRTLGAAAGSALGLVKSVGLVRAAMSASSASFARGVGKTLSRSASGSAGFVRSVGLVRSSPISHHASLDASFLPGVVAEAARVFFAVARAIVGLVAPRPPAVVPSGRGMSAAARTTTAVVGQRTVEAATGARPLTFVAVAL